jgi:hypothetical protein
LPFAIIDRFRREMIRAATAPYVNSAGWLASLLASGVQRAIEKGPSEVRPQDKGGDPQCCPGHPIHVNGFHFPASYSPVGGLVRK